MLTRRPRLSVSRHGEREIRGHKTPVTPKCKCLILGNGHSSGDQSTLVRPVSETIGQNLRMRTLRLPIPAKKGGCAVRIGLSDRRNASGLPLRHSICNSLVFLAYSGRAAKYVDLAQSRWRCSAASGSHV
jgi:hypothetical protein